MAIHLALVHHPILNKAGDVIATNVTNFDLHDIARVCKTYGVKTYTIVHPNFEQQAFVQRIKEHWTTGYGRKFNLKRGQALEIVQTASSLADLKKSLVSPFVVATSANQAHAHPLKLKFDDLREKLEEFNQDVLILLGTGFGLTDEVILDSDALIEPITTNSGYNHLSVRVSAGIILDRLLG